MDESDTWKIKIRIVTTEMSLWSKRTSLLNSLIPRHFQKPKVFKRKQIIDQVPKDSNIWNRSLTTTLPACSVVIHITFGNNNNDEKKV